MRSTVTSRFIGGLARVSLVLLAIATATAQQTTPPNATSTSTSPSPTAGTTPTGQEAPITLAPFEVSTEQDTGYVAQNTTAGSRLNTNLKDLAAPISVFTAEFLEDIGATNLTELSQYTVNTERVEGMVGDVANGNEFATNDASFRVRGLPTAGRMINYFSRGTEVDTFNTERVEFSRGPNAVLFGLGQAGGAFNVRTKRARLRDPQYSAAIRVGDYDALRISTDIDQTLIRNRLGLRINAVRDNKNSWRPHEFKDQERLDLAARWKITPRTDLNLEYEIGHVEASVHRPWASFDSFTFWDSLGRPLDTVAGAGVTRGTTNIGGIYTVFDSTNNRVLNLQNQSRSAQTPAPGTTDSTPTANPMLTDFNVVPRAIAVGGPGIGTAQDVKIFTGTLQHEVVDNLFVELAYNAQRTSVLGRDIGNTEIRVHWDTSPTLPTIPGVIAAGTPNPNAGQPYVEGMVFFRNRWVHDDNARFTGSYEFGTGRLEKFLGRHRIAGLFQRDETRTRILSGNERIVQNPYNTTMPNHAQNAFRRRTYVDLSGPVANVALADFRAHPIVDVMDLSRGVPITVAPVPTNATDDKRVVESKMFVAQSRFLRDRLVTTFGYRIDDVTTTRGSSLREPGFGPFPVGNLYAVPGDVGIDSEGRTQTTGGVFHFTNWLAGFYNQSKSFAIPNLNQRIARGEPAPSPTGVGRDYGLKFSLLEGRLFATISYYETSARNDSASLNASFSSGNLNLIWEALEAEGILAQQGINMDDVRLNLNAFTFDSDSEGFEFELVANPTPAWRVSLNFADTKMVQTNTARELLDYVNQHRGLWEQHLDLAAGNNTVGGFLGIFDDDAENRFIRPEGARKMGDSRYTGNFRTNYTFRRGALRGVSAGFGVRWRGEPVLGYSSADPATRQAIMGDETLLADLNLAYRFTPREFFGRRVEISTQLNVNNVFKEDDLVPTRVFDNGTIRTYRFQVPRDIFLTTTFRF